MKRETPVVLVLWEEVVNDLLECTSHFPRTLRMSLASRIESLALETWEQLVEARYSRQFREPLQRANMNLEKLRLLLRLSYRRKCLAEKRLHTLIEKIDEVGRMIGGWLQSEKG